MAVTNKLKLASFNCKHFKDSGPKYEFMQKLMLNNDILFVQEHCLYSSQLFKLKKCGNNVELIGKSSMSENVMLRGRPHGGCAILYNAAHGFEVIGVETKQDRLCAGHLVIKDSSDILLLNAYMSCDNTCDDIFNEVLDEVEQIIHSINPSHIIFGGDLNTDFSRNSHHSVILKQFIDSIGMSVGIDCVIADVPYTFIGNLSSSRIDHFLISSGIVSSMISCNILDNHLMSDHVPIEMTINVDVVHMNNSLRHATPKSAWDRASEEEISQYKSHLDENLRRITCDKDVLTCNSIHCNKHTEEVNHLYSDIIAACICASDSCIPKAGMHSSKDKCKTSANIPGWNEYVEPLRQESLLWHHEWKAAGCPRVGFVADQHRLSRANYHRVLRKVIRDTELIKMERMAAAISENRYRDLWGFIGIYSTCF